MKPMLSATLDDPATLDWSRTWLVSAKLDGIRALVINGVVLSRSLKQIPNDYIQNLFGKFENFDGELIVGEPTSKTCYRDTVSGVMSKDGEPNVRFFVFDHFEAPSQPYRERLKRLKGILNPRIVIHPQHVVSCVNTLLELEEKKLELGYEGLIIRDAAAPYKFGRATLREGGLNKLKRFVDAEATVIGFEERMHNGNEATTNELGRTKRSSHQSGKTGRGDLGALIVRMDGVEFNIGTGFDDDERGRVWQQQDHYLGRLAKFKYFPVGVKDAPRHPVFLGWREEIDT